MRQSRKGTPERQFAGQLIRRTTVLRGVGLFATATVSAALFAGPASSAPAGVGPVTPDRAAQLNSQSSAAANDVDAQTAAADAAAQRLADVQTQATGAQTALNDAQGQLNSAQATLASRQTELAHAQTAQDQAQQRVDAATARLNVSRDQMRMMLRGALQAGVGGDLDVLMDSGNPGDLNDRLGVLNHLSEARNRQIDDLTAMHDQLADQERQLAVARQRSADAVSAANEQVTSVQTLVNNAASAQARLLTLLQDRQSAADAARRLADDARTRYSQLQAASDQLTAMLQARARSHPVATAELPDTGGAGGTTAGGAVSSAGLVMPTTGTYSSPFGYRVDPFTHIGQLHAGQDIAAATGTPIYAATSGTVAYAGWESGYGNYTCIDRGAGFATCYGHQSQIMVSVGQSVRRGQEIGLMGSTGNSTGPHLHFEVRINGVPVNPVPYLP